MKQHDKHQGGFMGGESIFIIAIVAMGIFGVYKYVASETSSYTLVQENTKAIQNEVHSLADLITQQNDKLRGQQAQINELVKKLDIMEDMVVQNDKDLDDAHEHLARVREMQQAVKPVVFPKTFLVELVSPKSPIPIKVIKNASVSQTKTSLRKTKTGYDSRSETKTSTRKKAKSMPGAAGAKRAMKKAKL